MVVKFVYLLNMFLVDVVGGYGIFWWFGFVFWFLGESGYDIIWVGGF